MAADDSKDASPFQIDVSAAHADREAELADRYGGDVKVTLPERRPGSCNVRAFINGSISFERVVCIFLTPPPRRAADCVSPRRRQHA